MRLSLLAAAAASALVSFSIPSTAVYAGLSELRAIRAQAGQLDAAALNPLRAVYDWEQSKILAGETPGQLGMPVSKVTFDPMTTPLMSADPGRLSANEVAPQLDYEMRENNRRMEYARNATSNPNAGPTPQ